MARGNETKTIAGSVPRYWLRSSTDREGNPDQFLLFSKLPFEIRLHIWEDAIETRVMPMNLHNSFFSIISVPAILHVNKEARQIGLKAYTLLPKPDSAWSDFKQYKALAEDQEVLKEKEWHLQFLNKPQYFNFDKDVFVGLVFGAQFPSKGWMFPNYLLTPYVKNLGVVRNIPYDQKALPTPNYSHASICQELWLPGLKSVNFLYTNINYFKSSGLLAFEKVTLAPEMQNIPDLDEKSMLEYPGKRKLFVSKEGLERAWKSTAELLKEWNGDITVPMKVFRVIQGKQR